MYYTVVTTRSIEQTFLGIEINMIIIWIQHTTQSLQEDAFAESTGHVFNRNKAQMPFRDGEWSPSQQSVKPVTLNLCDKCVFWKTKNKINHFVKWSDIEIELQYVLYMHAELFPNRPNYPKT
jgi:hypothetical protein